MSTFSIQSDQGGVTFNLDSYMAPIPFQIEVRDHRLHTVYRKWHSLNDSSRIEQQPGVYAVRFTTANGVAHEEVVEVKPGENQQHSVMMGENSPHESQAWAYAVQSLDGPSNSLLSDPVMEGLWMRRWERKLLEDGELEWSTTPTVNERGWHAAREEDGVVCRMHLRHKDRITMLQIGGPTVPMKFVAVPFHHEVQVLIRPTTAPEGFGHPVDVILSTDDWNMESLLTLMQRGDTGKAAQFVSESTLAEDMLNKKLANPYRAAVGGYYLLQVQDFERLHNWTRNLADWFEWLADGPVIHAWQLMEQASHEERVNLRDELYKQACERLLEAVKRGVPVFTQGVRLLKDGLAVFASGRILPDYQESVLNVMSKVNEYVAALDWTATRTTFTGNHPDRPSLRYHVGGAEDLDEGSFQFVYDIPPAQMLEKGMIKAGDRLVTTYQDRPFEAVVLEDGTLSLEGGDPLLDTGKGYSSLGAIQKAVSGQTSNAWDAWKIKGEAESLRLRTQSFFE